MKPAMTPQQTSLTDDKRSALAIYKDMAVGDASCVSFLYYEVLQLLLANMGGAVGLAARMIAYKPLFKNFGKGSVLGKGCVLRNPAKIEIGKRCLIDDYGTLDARGRESSIILGDYVSLGRASAVVAKNAEIVLEDGVNIGSNCRIATQSKVVIGESTLIAAYAYIGAGNHKQGDADKPLIAQDMDIKGGVTIGKNVWIGTRATILDGVHIGDGAIIGAHALVRSDVPAGKTAVGIPARIL